MAACLKQEGVEEINVAITPIMFILVPNFMSSYLLRYLP